MKVMVRYFASIREDIGVASEVLDTNAANLMELRDELLALSAAHAQALARGKAVRMALDQVMCGESELLLDGCELAFFPPVTGG